MKKINRAAFFSVLVILAYVLSACSGVPAVQSGNDQQQAGQTRDVVFTGTVENVNGNQWTVSGQTITIEAGTALGQNIAVGDNVKVEARVAADGSVTALKIEVSGAGDANANGNSNSSNTNDSNTNGNASNSNDNQGDNSNASNGNGNGNGNDNGNSSTGVEQELSGVVEAITTQSITINGVVYLIADFTEFKGIVALGDKVKVHVILNADGSLTIREIEKSGQPGLGNSNSNSNSSDDKSNLNSNSSGDDHGGNGNDDNGNDDHGNDNGNDNGDDNGGGGNGNGNG